MAAQVNISTKRSAIDFEKAFRFGAWGALGGSVVSWAIQFVIGLIATLALLALGRGDQIETLFTNQRSLVGNLIAMGIVFGTVGAGASIALLCGYSLYMKKGLQLWQSTYRGSLIGFIGGFISGAIAQFAFNIAQGIYGVAKETGFSGWPIESCRIICWGIAGGLMGFGLSFRIHNLGRLRGLAGGAAGGLIGGLVYVFSILATGEHGGSFVGQAAIGFFIGCMVIFAETMFREAWLVVQYAPGEFRNISLGREAVSIGSDKTCTIYARNASPVALRYSLEEGSILCEDAASGQTTTVPPGDCKAVGNLTVTVCAVGSKTQTVAAATLTAAHIQGFFIRLSSGRRIPLSNGARLTVTDIAGLEPSANDQTVAEVVPNPSDATVIGLKNRSRQVWSATTATGDKRVIEPTRSLRPATGTKINFGSTKGEICG